jgi:hypothetical protein
MDDEAPDSPTSATKVDPGSRQPTEAELSRIAREAVHQPPDARLDKQLVRMGLLDDPDAAEAQETARPAVPVMAAAPAPTPDPELERLRGEYERLRAELSRSIVVVRALIAIVAVLGVIVVALLVR